MAVISIPFRFRSRRVRAAHRPRRGGHTNLHLVTTGTLRTRLPGEARRNRVDSLAPAHRAHRSRVDRARRARRAVAPGAVARTAIRAGVHESAAARSPDLRAGWLRGAGRGRSRSGRVGLRNTTEGRTSAEIHAERGDWQLFRDGCPGGEAPGTGRRARRSRRRACARSPGKRAAVLERPLLARAHRALARSAAVRRPALRARHGEFVCARLCTRSVGAGSPTLE